MLRLLFVIASLCSLHSLCAMEGDPVFDLYEWNFGKIYEGDGMVSHTFTLTNNGKKDLLISKVVPSCSCVSVDYPRNPIKAGGSEALTVSFSPSGAVGPVFRSIEVFNADNECFGTLEISADVTPVDRSIQERYHNTLADFLYVSLVKIPFGYVYHGEQKTKAVMIANTSSQPMMLEAASQSSHLSVVCPDHLEPNEEREVVLTYTSPDDRSLFSTFVDTVTFKVNGQPARGSLTTNMICLAKTEDTPDAAILRTYPSYGQLKKSKSRYTARFDIFNDGPSTLVVHALETPQGVSTNIKAGRELRQGERFEVQLTADSPTPFRVSLFTNDPKRPVKEIDIH